MLRGNRQLLPVETRCLTLAFGGMPYLSNSVKTAASRRVSPSPSRNHPDRRGPNRAPRPSGCLLVTSFSVAVITAPSRRTSRSACHAENAPLGLELAFRQELRCRRSPGWGPSALRSGHDGRRDWIGHRVAFVGAGLAVISERDQAGRLVPARQSSWDEGSCSSRRSHHCRCRSTPHARR